MLRRPDMYPHMTLWSNLADVQRLLEIHATVAGVGPGHKHDVEVLNKSAVVLLVACWEAFIEDLAATAFSILLRNAKSHDLFSSTVLAEAAKPLKASADPRAPWELAGDGWKNVLKKHKSTLFERYIGKLNTPRPGQVNALYKSLLGIRSLSSVWHWRGMSVKAASDKLEELVTLRGNIAHRVATARRVYKKHVRDYIDFVNRISVETSNTVRTLIIRKTRKSPWVLYSYKPVKKS